MMFLSNKRNRLVVGAVALVVLVGIGVGAGILIARGRTVVYTEKPSGRPAKQIDNPYQHNAPIPSGREVYQIVSGESTYPRFTQAAIDPVDAHPEETQTLEVAFEDTVEPKEVVVDMETDNGYVRIRLHRSEKDKIADPNADSRQRYAVRDGVVVPVSATADSVGAQRVGASAPNQGVGVAQAAQESGESVKTFIYEGSWVVKDTHSEDYDATFKVTNANGESNQLTLTWRDPCTPGLRGAWTLDGNCGFNTTDGVAPDINGNGDVTISGSYTLTLSAPFVFYPGKKMVISSGSVAIGTGGKIMESKLWVLDADGDRWGVSKLAQTSNPGTGYYDQSTYPASASAVSTNYGNDGASLATGGTVAWTNPKSAETTNNTYATASLGKNIVSRYSAVRGFGFAISSDAIVTGIKVEVERKAASTNSIRDNATYGVRMTKDGTNLVGSVLTVSGFWTTSDVFASYGSSTEMWGTTWTPSEINSANFGVAIAADNTAVSSVVASIDSMRITPYARTPNITAMNDCNDSNSGLTNNCNSAPVCAPSSQNVGVDIDANLTASGGNGTYSWTATGGSPSSGSGSAFSVSYSTTGAKTVTVTSNSQNANCTVNVSTSPPPVCDPSTQTVNVSETAALTASGGTVIYVWSAPGGTPSSQTGGASFNVSYGSEGSKTVTLTSGSETTTCAVVVGSANCYPDADGDGHYTTSVQTSCSGSYSSSVGDDCDDANANAYPGQTGSFGTPRANGSYDYDCNGSDAPTVDWLAPNPCSSVSTQAECRTGYTSTIPACGQSAAKSCCLWIDSACVAPESCSPITTQYCY